MQRSPSSIAIGSSVVSAILGLALVGAPGADAAVATFSNPGAIAVPGSGTGSVFGAPANPYPSTIAVSGLTGPILDIDVTLFGLSHVFPGDIGILLVGPGGQNALILSDAGGASAVANLTITLDQDAASGVSQTALVSGTFRPTNFGSGDLFPSPAPAGPYTNSSLDIFDGLNANGAWSLYVVDDNVIDTGNIAGGWSLTVTTQDEVAVPEPASLALLGVGLAGIAFARRRRR